MSRRKQLIVFFEQYEAHLNSAILCHEPGAAAVAAAFADSFVTASPDGVRSATNDDEFVASIESGCDFYRGLGTRALRLEGIDSTPIDAEHVMARVHWLGEYRRADGTDLSIPFDIVYFVRMRGDDVRIFGQVTGDEQRALRSHGLID